MSATRVSKPLLRAECQDCPTTRNEEWGYDEKVACEARNESIVKAWAWRHVYAADSPTKGHRLKFSHVTRIAVDMEHLNPEVLQKIWGGERRV